MSAPDLTRCPDAVLLQPLGPHSWSVRLPNGHELAGVIHRVDREAAAALAPGQQITIEICPADFSVGKIVLGGRASDQRPTEKAAVVAASSRF